MLAAIDESSQCMAIQNAVTSVNEVIKRARRGRFDSKRPVSFGGIVTLGAADNGMRGEDDGGGKHSTEGMGCDANGSAVKKGDFGDITSEISVYHGGKGGAQSDAGNCPAGGYEGLWSLLGKCCGHSPETGLSYGQ